MLGFIDFLAGRSNKLLRDMLGASALVVIVGAATVVSIRTAVETYRVARQPLPARVETARAPSSDGPIVVITRSVLDDPILTGSLPGRPAGAHPRTSDSRK